MGVDLMIESTKRYEPCKNKGCCYAVGGGTSKCKKCYDEYNEYVRGLTN